MITIADKIRQKKDEIRCLELDALIEKREYYLHLLSELGEIIKDDSLYTTSELREKINKIYNIGQEVEIR